MARIVDRPDLLVTRPPPVARLVLQAAPGDGAALLGAAGLGVPACALSSWSGSGWSVLALAPGEWWLIGPEGGAEAIAARLADAPRPHSLVDISDRNLSLRIEGAAAARLLAAGCPLDLDSVAPGAATRTLLGKLPVMLWRPAATPIFVLEYFRSFDDYAVAFIRTAAEDLPADSGEGGA